MLYHLPKQKQLDTYEVEKYMVELAEVNKAHDKMLFQGKIGNNFLIFTFLKQSFNESLDF